MLKDYQGLSTIFSFQGQHIQPIVQQTWLMTTLLIIMGPNVNRDFSGHQNKWPPSTRTLVSKVKKVTMIYSITPAHK